MLTGYLYINFYNNTYTTAQARRKVFVIGAAKGVDPDKNVGGGGV